MHGRLRIIAINDVYSLAHLPRLATLVRELSRRTDVDRTLVTLAGDFVAPSLLSSLDQGRGMVDCLRALPVDIAILGNHEDEIEPGELRARLRELGATLLTTNVHGLEPSAVDRLVIDVGDLRVGFVGLTDGDPSLFRRVPFGGARIEPVLAAASRVVRELLEDQDCACVIAVTHQPVAADRALARALPAVPLILGGHEHVDMIEQVGETLVVKAPSDAVRAAVVDLVWDGEHSPRVSARFEDVRREDEDPSMRARADAHLAKVRELESATLVTLPPGVRLSSVGARARQTTLGTLLCSRLRDTLAADAALLNGGGIRGSRDYDTRLTYGDILTEVPFDNEIVLAPLPGAVLDDAIVFSRAKAPVETGGFLQVDDAMHLGPDGHLAVVAGAPFDPARVYRVALVRNLFLGLDHVEPLVRFAREHAEAVPPPTSGREIKVALVAAFASQLLEQLGGVAALDEDRDGAVRAGDVERALSSHAEGEHREGARLTATLVIGALDRDGDGAVGANEPTE